MNLTHEQKQIADLEAIKYKHVWENCETYGDKHHDVDLFKRIDPHYIGPEESVIVLGCGDGSLVDILIEYKYLAFGVDIYRHPNWDRQRNNNGRRFEYRKVYQQQPLWEPLPVPKTGSKWEMAICADVLEHIPEILLPNVLANIADCCDQAIFQIANMKSEFNGYNLHMIKKDVRWWSDVLLECMHGKTLINKEEQAEAPPGRFVIHWHK